MSSELEPGHPAGTSVRWAPAEASTYTPKAATARNGIR